MLDTLSAPVNATSPKTFSLSDAFVVPMPTFDNVWIPVLLETNLPPVPPPPPEELIVT